MPTASPELRTRMGELFGDEIEDGGPISFLIKAGYRMTPQSFWNPKPGVKTYDDMTQDEYDCLQFLCQEWDFGGLTTMEGESA